MTPAFVQSAAAVVENVRLARNTYRIRLHCPELARLIRPGQFVMLRLPGRTDPLLGRPFALYDTVLDEAGQPVGVDVVYLVVGKMTGLLARGRGRRAGGGVGAAGQRLPRPGRSQARRPGRRRHRPDAVPGARPRPARRRAATAAGRPGASRSGYLSITACAPPTWRRASRTSARPAPRSISPATTAASASTATSRSCSNSTRRRTA